MRVLKTEVNKTSEDFRRAQAQYESLTADLKKHLTIVQAGGPADAVALHKKRGKMTARERIAALIELYAAWNQASPSPDLNARLAEWQRKLAEFDAAASFMTGQILTVNLPSSRQGILIPDRAVVHTGQDTTVYVRTAAGVEARNLNLRSLGADYLAESGIREGEQIAIQGTAVLKGIQLGLGGGE